MSETLPANQARLPSVLGLVVARGGSKGIPRKNLQPLAGKPLIVHTFDAARASRTLDRVVLSTDDEEIAALARCCGVEAPFRRPPELATDSSLVIAVGLHALEWLEKNDRYQPDYVLLLQPTSPLRTAADIDAAVELAASHNADAVVSVTETPQHPYLMKVITPAGHLAPFMENPHSTSRRQDLPKAYALNGAIYLVRRPVLFSQKSWCPANALPLILPPDRSIDMDSPLDFKLAEFLLTSPAAHR